MATGHERRELRDRPPPILRTARATPRRPGRDGRSVRAALPANRSEFPAECGELRYVDRIRSAYPIHPELFDRLYEDWSTVERFQRTRGVLRLMAAVIHALWKSDDRSR